MCNRNGVWSFKAGLKRLPSCCNRTLKLWIYIHSSFWYKPWYKNFGNFGYLTFCKRTPFWKYKHIPGIEEQCHFLQNIIYIHGIGPGSPWDISTDPEKNPHSVVLGGDRRVHQILTPTTTLHDLWSLDFHVNWMFLWLYASHLTLRSSGLRWSCIVCTGRFLFSPFFYILVSFCLQNSYPVLISGLFYIAFVWALISCRSYQLGFLFVGPRRRTDTPNIADVGKTAEAACSAAHRPL